MVPALTIATAALAQPAGEPVRDGAPRFEQMRAHHDAMKRQRLDDLRIVLRLRPDQEPALAALAAAREPHRPGMMARPSAPQTTPQRLEAMTRREDAMRAAHDRHRDALAKFYAALSPDQQKVFDALQRLEGGRHDGRGRGHMAGRGAHGGHGFAMRRGAPGPHED